MDNEVVCPRCGVRAGTEPFCASCGENLGRYRRLLTRAEWEYRQETGKHVGGFQGWGQFFSLEKGWVQWLLGLVVANAVALFLFSWGVNAATYLGVGFVAGTAVAWFLGWRYSSNESRPWEDKWAAEEAAVLQSERDELIEAWRGVEINPEELDRPTRRALRDAGLLDE